MFLIYMVRNHWWVPIDAMRDYMSRLEGGFQRRAIHLLAEGSGNQKSDLSLYEIHIEEESEEGKLYNVKQEIYRLPDRLMESFALYFGICDGSNYDKLLSLKEKNDKEKNTKIDCKELKLISIMDSIANEIRLRTYLKNGGQKEQMVSIQSKIFNKSNALENLMYFFGLDSWSNEYLSDYLVRYYSIALPFHHSLKEFFIIKKI